MELKISHHFLVKLNIQVDYIAQHRPNVARKFKNELIKSLKTIGLNPWKNRKSIFFESDEIRDFIFKKHIIVYKIDQSKNEIVIFSLVYNQENTSDKS